MSAPSLEHLAAIAQEDGMIKYKDCIKLMNLARAEGEMEGITKTLKHVRILQDEK